MTDISLDTIARRAKLGKGQFVKNQIKGWEKHLRSIPDDLVIPLMTAYGIELQTAEITLTKIFEERERKLAALDPPVFKNELGSYLAQTREITGLTIMDISVQTDVPAWSIKGWETGHFRVPENNYSVIFAAYEVDRYWINKFIQLGTLSLPRSRAELPAYLHSVREILDINLTDVGQRIGLKKAAVSRRINNPDYRSQQGLVTIIAAHQLPSRLHTAVIQALGLMVSGRKETASDWKPSLIADPETSKYIGAMVKAIRKRNKLSVESVANPMGVSAVRIIAYETGRRIPLVDVLRWAQLCQAEPHELERLSAVIQRAGLDIDLGNPAAALLGRILAKQRDNVHFSLSEASNNALIGHSSLPLIETGAQLPTTEQLEQLLTAYHTPADIRRHTSLILRLAHSADFSLFDTEMPTMDLRWLIDQMLAIKLTIIAAYETPAQLITTDEAIDETLVTPIQWSPIERRQRFINLLHHQFETAKPTNVTAYSTPAALNTLYQTWLGRPLNRWPATTRSRYRVHLNTLITYLQKGTLKVIPNTAMESDRKNTYIAQFYTGETSIYQTYGKTLAKITDPTNIQVFQNRARTIEAHIVPTSQVITDLSNLRDTISKS
jgi:DNA-binding transcriptional regulator YiaG